ncbi:MAG: family 4 carbohydrate esterase, partial [Benniella sp.]
ASYPRAGAVPPVDSPQVQAWLKEIDLSGAPDISLNHGEPPSCPSKIDPNVCYWTCQNCAADDVVSCPDTNVWGLAFDDGPTEVTPSLLEFLLEQNVKATFFLIGGNVVQHPDIVRTEITHGHHLASHTWSHHALTTLSNEQIVAEIKWTEKAIEDATGYRVKYMRPPYGDIDNRVRFVLKKLGYIVVDWTGDTFDTNDWKIPQKQATASAVVTHFKTSISNYNDKTSADKKGFISLEHDLSVDTVAVAKSLIPYGVDHGLIIQSVATCLRDD